MRFAIPFVLLLLGLQSSYAQNPVEPKWTKLVSENREFSVSLPGDLMVHKDEKRRLVSVLANTNDVSFKVQIGKDSSASQLKFYSEDEARRKLRIVEIVGQRV